MYLTCHSGIRASSDEESEEQAPTLPAQPNDAPTPQPLIFGLGVCGVWDQRDVSGRYARLSKRGLKHTAPAVLNGGERAEDAVPSPSSPLRQPPPERVCPDHPLDQLLPEHAVRRHAVPLLAHQLSGAQRFGIQVGQDVLSNMIQSPSWEKKRKNRRKIKHYLFGRCAV